MSVPLRPSGAAWVLLSLLAAGCRTPGLGALRARGVEVVEVATSFAEPGRGELKLVLDVANPELTAGEVSSVGWELWLSGRWFAAGAQAVSAQLPAAGSARVALSFPLEFRGLGVSGQPTSLEVGVRGSLTARFSGDEQRLPFEDARRIRSQGAPVFSTSPAEE